LNEKQEEQGAKRYANRATSRGLGPRPHPRIATQIAAPRFYALLLLPEGGADAPAFRSARSVGEMHFKVSPDWRGVIVAAR